MKLVAQGVALSALLAMAACANNPNRPSDTGSMATPAPARAGIIDPSVRQGRDVGSMSEPSASGGVRAAPAAGRDTGSMAEPTAAQGNASTRRITP